MEENMIGLWINNKTRKPYWVTGTVVNTTNSNDNQIMVLHGVAIVPLSEQMFVREIEEFKAKFTKQ